MTYNRFINWLKISISGILILIIAGLNGCKKDSGSDNNPNSDYYLTANVNGVAWSSNVASGIDKSPALAAIVTKGTVTAVVLFGIKAVNNDSSAIAVIFPENITLNKNTTFNAAKNSEAAYIAETAPGAQSYFGYNTTPATGGSGNFTITTFDQSTKLIEGTFSGTFGSLNGKPPVEITNGKFKCPFTTDINQLPKSGGLKL